MDGGILEIMYGTGEVEEKKNLYTRRERSRCMTYLIAAASGREKVGTNPEVTVLSEERLHSPWNTGSRSWGAV